MGQTKIIFFDIDGTLIDMQKKQISEKTMDMLKQLQKNGILICLATGRTPVSLPVFPGIEFDAYLTFNGSLCYTKNETIKSTPIPADTVQKLIENATKMGRPVSLATRDRLAANGTDADLTEYYSFAHLGVDIPEDFTEVSHQEVYQIMLGCEEKDYPALLENVEDAKIAAWWSRAVDVIPASGGKGIGIQKMLEYFGFSKEEALAFGDGNNDIEMLQAVGTGIAMANASEQLKAVADDICGHVAEDGIYHYCVENGLI